ncbi:MAG TPA: polysaccharide deacetylase family protein [Myxococcales bacterium]|jgi:peptidoglycan/xylan/chitin deacetylase (PgdA/CDA1 family)
MGEAGAQQGIHFIGHAQLAEILRIAACVQGGVRARVKGWVKWLLFQTGAHRALERRPRGPCGYVITYHKVEHRPAGPFGMLALDVPAFTEHVEFLAHNYEVVPLSVLTRGLKSGRLPSRAVSLTFDDGYRNNLVLAWPVLHRYHVPATVFVTAGLIGTRRWMWTNELIEMALRYGMTPVGAASGDSLLSALLQAEIPPWMRAEASIEYLLRLGAERREAILGRLRARYPVEPDDENRFLSWEEVRALKAGGIEIGSHTMTHPVLPDLDGEQVERELEASRSEIAAQVGEAPRLFCYPHGVFSPPVKALTGRYYEAAVSTIPGENTPTTDPLELRRVAAYSVDDLAFQLARPH